VNDVADLVGISTSSVRRLIADGVLPRVPHTERVLVARTAVERWVNQTEGSAA
jgi:excisionase family DNA binding protein